MIKCKGDPGYKEKAYLRRGKGEGEGNRKFIYCYCDNELFELLRSFAQAKDIQSFRSEKNKHIQHISRAEEKNCCLRFSKKISIDNSTRYT